ncbi:hypothetical protein BH09ACT5_BH09ACT5_00780 [soil metagenome]
MSTAPRILTARRAFSAAAALLLATGLAGCSLVQTAPPPELTGLAKCALGSTWKLDTAKLAEAVQAELGSRGVGATVAAEGSQTLTWGLDSAMALDTDYTLTFTSGPDDQKTVVTDKHSGESGGIAYINSDVAIPRNWDASGLNVKTTATLNGAELESLPYTLVPTDIDDSVGIELTCDGSTLTTHQRGSELTLTWTK